MNQVWPLPTISVHYSLEKSDNETILYIYPNGEDENSDNSYRFCIPKHITNEFVNATVSSMQRNILSSIVETIMYIVKIDEKMFKQYLDEQND